MSKRDETASCGRCGKRFASSDTITLVDSGDRCYRCFNEEMADRLGVVFDASNFEPVMVTDADGVAHTFQIRSLLVPTGHELEAFEVDRTKPGGYRFAVLGDVEADCWQLFRRLYEKIRRELSVRHVERTTHGWQIGPEQRLVGRIEWDDATDGRTPMLVIDGRAFTWDEVGRMLITFEGFTLNARIEDTIELVDVDPGSTVDG